MSEHTPTPWSQECHLNEITQSPFASIHSEAANVDVAFLSLNPQHVAANAAFIVLAVNSHDALVKALEDISKQHTSEELRAIVAKECATSEAAMSWHSSASLADFEGGYDECVKIARAALAKVKS